MRRDAVSLEVVELREHLALDGLERLPGRRDRDRVKQVRVLQDIGVPEGGNRDPLVVDEVARHPRALAVKQNLRRQVQRVRIGMPVVHDVIRDDDGRERPFFLDRRAAFLRLLRLFRDIARHRPGGLRHAAEVLLHQLRGLRGIKVADNRHHRVFRNVVRVVEIADIL